MKISNSGLELIKKYEGCRLIAYLCPSGVWTIGYGHTNGVRQGMTITQSQADEYLRKDVYKAENYVNSYDNIYHFSQEQFDALVSFTYNCGAGNLKKLVNGGMRTIGEISNAIPTFNKSKGKVLNGLVRRRADEKALFDKGTTLKPLKTVAKEVLAGKWGNGAERKENLIKAGYNYGEVQAEVNRLASKKTMIINRAYNEVGVSENPANSNNVKYNTWYYGKEVSGSAYPWCAVFISWLFRNNVDLCPKTASCLTMLEWFEKRNQIVTNPEPGDIVFMKFSTNNRRTNHIGIVIGTKDNMIFTIEGNTSNSSQDNGGKVMKRTRTKNIVAFARPKY